MELGLKELKTQDLEQCYSYTFNTHIRKYFNTQPGTHPTVSHSTAEIELDV